MDDEQVRLIMAERARGRTDIVADLRQMADDDPMTSNERDNGHVYLLAHPEASHQETLVDLLGRKNASVIINGILDDVERDSGGWQFEPKLHQLPWRIIRAEGQAFTKVSPGDRLYESGLLDLLIREDGELRLTCGRGTDFAGHGALPEPRPVVYA
jgi:hypothetical protein